MGRNIFKSNKFPKYYKSQEGKYGTGETKQIQQQETMENTDIKLETLKCHQSFN